MSYLENLKQLKAELLEHKSGYVELGILSGKVNVERSTALHILDSAIATCELADSLGGSQIDEYRRAIQQMVFKDLVELQKERFKTDLEIDVESLVGKLFRSDTLEAIRVYAVDHVGKYVYAEVVPNCATGRSILSAEIKRYPGYSLDIKYNTPREVKFAPIFEPVLQPKPNIAELLGKPFSTLSYPLVFVHCIDFKSKIIHVTPVRNLDIENVGNLSVLLRDVFPDFTYKIDKTITDLTFEYSGGELCLKNLNN